jgi:hypothetical protein
MTHINTSEQESRITSPTEIKDTAPDAQEIKDTIHNMQELDDAALQDINGGIISFGKFMRKVGNVAKKVFWV